MGQIKAAFPPCLGRGFHAHLLLIFLGQVEHRALGGQPAVRAERGNRIEQAVLPLWGQVAQQPLGAEGCRSGPGRSRRSSAPSVIVSQIDSHGVPFCVRFGVRGPCLELDDCGLVDLVDHRARGPGRRYARVSAQPQNHYLPNTRRGCVTEKSHRRTWSESRCCRSSTDPRWRGRRCPQASTRCWPAG